MASSEASRVFKQEKKLLLLIFKEFRAQTKHLLNASSCSIDLQNSK